MSLKRKIGRESIPHERHVERAFDPNNSIGYLIRDTHRALARALHERLVAYGVTMGMWYFLRALWDRDGITQRELSERVRMMEPTTASALQNMERRGLVVRLRDSHDRRKVNVRLTRKGHQLKRKLLPYAADVNAIALRGVSTDEIQKMRGTLQKIRANLDAELGRIAK